MDPKQRLQELIDASEALKTISEEERAGRIEVMMAATPEQMQQFIKVFEDEQVRLTQIDEDFLKHEGEINEYIANANAEKRNKAREERAAQEIEIKKNDDQYAEDLLKKLDEIV